MSFMQQSMPPPPPPSMIPKQPAETKPIKIGVQRKAPAPAPAPVEMRAPSVNIDDLLKDIKTTVAPSPAPAPPSAMKKNKAGSTGKNSVVIRL